MNKVELQKVLKDITKKIHTLEEKLHTKSLEADRLLDKRMRSVITLDESTKLHKKIMKAYEVRDNLAKEIETLRNEKRAMIDNWRIQQLL